MLESTVETALVERIKALGGDTRKVKWLCRNGAPDRLVMLPFSLKGPAKTIWVELKAPGKKPRPNQVREHESLRALGQTVLVINTIELVDKHFPL